MKSFASFLPEIQLCQRTQDPERMRRLVLAFIDSLHDGPEDHDIASKLFVAGSLCTHLGDNAQAELLLRRAIAIFTRLGNPANVAFCNLDLGTALLHSRNFSGAIEALTLAIGGLEAYHGLSLDLVPELAKLAWAHWESGDPGSTISVLERACGIIRSLAGDHDVRLPQMEGLLGKAYLAVGEPLMAERVLERAAVAARRHGLRVRLAVILRELGNLQASNLRFEEACRTLEEAVIAAQASGELDCCLPTYREELAKVRQLGRILGFSSTSG